MNIGIIGAGRVGLTLSIVFKRAGFSVLVASRKRVSAEKASRISNARAVEIPEAAKADIVFLTVPDSEIVNVARSIENVLNKKQTVVHTSGVFSSEIISFLPSRTCALHPLKSFSDPILSADTISGTLFTFDGDESAFSVISYLVEKIGDRIVKIKPSDKPVYHLAAVLTANYTVTLFSISKDMLEAIGFTDKDANDALLNLISGVVRNIKNRGAVDALTGPIVRGDAETLRLHLMHIEDKNLETIYKSLAFATLKIAKKQGLSEDKIRKIEEVLNG